MIRAEGIAARRGAREVLRDVTLSAGAGEVAAVVGRSGVGKSTLLRVLAGLEPATAGRVEGGPCALMPQGDALLPWRGALANALVGARLDGLPAAAAEAEGRALFARFGLAGREDDPPHVLSGGMRRRVALLRTFLAHRPALLLDEPFGALDALARDDLAGWLEGVLADLPRAVVLVTHDVDEAVRLGTRVHVLAGAPAQVVATVEPRALGPAAARAAVLDALSGG